MIRYIFIILLFTATSFAEDILSKLEVFDKACLTDITAEGVTTLMPTYLNKNRPPIPIKWKIVICGGDCLITEEAITKPHELYTQNEHSVPPNTPQRAFLKRTTLFSAESSIQRTIYETFKTDEAGNTTILSPSSLLGINNSNSKAFFLPYKQILWSMGRGYAENIESFSEITDRGDGTFYCRGKGSSFSGKNGIWELIIEPDSMYLAREARFFPEREDKNTKRDEPLLEIVTKGSLWTDGICAPESTVWKDQYSATKQRREMPYHCEQVKLKGDPQLIEEIKKTMLGPFEYLTVVVDERTHPVWANEFKPGETYNEGTKILADYRYNLKDYHPEKLFNEDAHHTELDTDQFNETLEAQKLKNQTEVPSVVNKNRTPNNVKQENSISHSILLISVIFLVFLSVVFLIFRRKNEKK